MMFTSDESLPSEIGSKHIEDFYLYCTLELDSGSLSWPLSPSRNECGLLWKPCVTGYKQSASLSARRMESV